MAMEKLSPDDSCCGCLLEGYGCPAIYEEDSSLVDYADVEKNVTAWAAEHPEPVYPTWGEWLESFGVVEVTKAKDRIITVPQYPTWYEYLFNVTRGENKWPVDDHEFCRWLDTTPIPDDIAQKLGIEPKEG